MKAISLLLCILAASTSAFTLAPVGPQRANAVRSAEVSMMAAKTAPKKPVKKVRVFSSP